MDKYLVDLLKQQAGNLATEKFRVNTLQMILKALLTG